MNDMMYLTLCGEIVIGTLTDAPSAVVCITEEGYTRYYPENTCTNNTYGNYLSCSRCGTDTYQGEDKFSYCPRCGARVEQ